MDNNFIGRFFLPKPDARPNKFCSIYINKTDYVKLGKAFEQGRTEERALIEVYHSNNGGIYGTLPTLKNRKYPVQDEHNEAKANGFQPQPEHRYKKEDEPNDNDIPF